jgi:lycopene cyclase domain-containing protein
VNYTWATLAGIIVAVVLDQFVLGTNLLRRKAFWLAYAIMLGFQLIINGVLTGLPIVRYDPDVIIGWHLAYAPIEDLLFGFALVVITLSIWVRLDAREPHHAARPDQPPHDA